MVLCIPGVKRANDYSRKDSTIGSSVCYSLVSLAEQVKESLCFLGAGSFMPAADRHRAFSGNLEDVRSRPSSISSKNCCRMWNRTLTVWSRIQCTVKAVTTKKWKQCSPNPGDWVKSRVHGRFLLSHKAFCFCWLGRPKNDNTLLGECFGKVSQRCRETKQ